MQGDYFNYRLKHRQYAMGVCDLQSKLLAMSKAPPRQFEATSTRRAQLQLDAEGRGTKKDISREGQSQEPRGESHVCSVPTRFSNVYDQL